MSRTATAKAPVEDLIVGRSIFCVGRVAVWECAFASAWCDRLSVRDLGTAAREYAASGSERSGGEARVPGCLPLHKSGGQTGTFQCYPPAKQRCAAILMWSCRAWTVNYRSSSVGQRRVPGYFVLRQLRL